MGVLNLIHLTLYMPKRCKTLNRANRLIHEWRAGVESFGAIGWHGGIFEHIGSNSQPQLHCHLIVASNIPESRMIDRWHKVTNIPRNLCIKVVPIYDLQGIISYIFYKNIKEAVRHCVISYREHLTVTS